MKEVTYRVKLGLKVQDGGKLLRALETLALVDTVVPSEQDLMVLALFNPGELFELILQFGVLSLDWVINEQNGVFLRVKDPFLKVLTNHFLGVLHLRDFVSLPIEW